MSSLVDCLIYLLLFSMNIKYRVLGDTDSFYHPPCWVSALSHNDIPPPHQKKMKPGICSFLATQKFSGSSKLGESFMFMTYWMAVDTELEQRSLYSVVWLSGSVRCLWMPVCCFRFRGWQSEFIVGSLSKVLNPFRKHILNRGGFIMAVLLLYSQK